MQRSILVLVVLSCIALSATANVFQERVRIAGEHRSHTIAKHGWSRVQRAVPSHPLSLLFALKQQNVDKLQSKLHEFSNPRSPSHGLRMTREQIRDLIAPSAVTVSSVTGWIKQTAPEAQVELNAGGDFLHVSLPAHRAETLFAVEFHVYRHVDTGREIVRALSDTATLPASIKPLIDIVGGLHSFPKHKPRFNRNAKISGNHAAPVRTMSVGDTNYTDTFITSAVGADNTVGLLIVPICANGMATLTTNASALCADHPPMIQSFNVRAIMTLTGQTVVGSVALSDLVVCKIVNDGSTPFPQTQCQLALKTVGGMVIENYKPYRFGVQALFAGGMRSPILMNANTQYPTIWAWPNALYQRYYVYPNQATGDVRSSQAVIEFSDEFYSPSDLKYFLTTVGVDASQADQVRVFGFNNGSIPGGEGNLDIQYMLALNPFARTTYWSVNPNGDGWIMEYQAEVSNTADTDLPLVHSISWGSNEADQDNDYLARATVEFMKMGARGVTVLVSSGDDGVSETDPNCNYTPDFPTSNPYVTSVGATSFSSYTSAACSGLKTPDSGVDVSCSVTGEIACSTLTGSLISTGGGFSSFHPQPSYQSKAVAEYLTFQSILPPASTFNRSNRGYPDLAALGRNVPIVINGGTYRADGTSCSAPIMGAIVALINDFYLQYYNRSLGWANPFWYDMAENRPSAFQDVIIGNNRCRSKRSLVPGGDVFCCPTGFNASAGWDPLTGLGSPNVIEVQQYLLKIATDNQISNLQTQVTQLNTQMSTLSSSLQTEVNSLSAQVTALSTGAVFVTSDTFESDRKKLAIGVIVVAVVCGFTLFGLAALMCRRKQAEAPHSTTGTMNERLLEVDA